MTFGEKIQKLRKEKGLSQEDLSYQLNVSRQAISKWENDNGYPETEKIVRMSKIFNVSLDYLLNDDQQKANVDNENEKGIYVSREMASGFMLYQQNKMRKIALSVSMFVAGPSLCFLDAEIGMLILMAVFIAGIALLISVKITDNPYKSIWLETLLLDKDVQNELASEYAEKKSKLQTFIIVGTVLIASGFLLVPLIVPVKLQIIDNVVFALGFLIAGAGTFLCIYCWNIIRVYKVLLTNIEN